VLGPEEFDKIEFQAARTGNHVRAAMRMTELARTAAEMRAGEADGGMSRAEAHLRAGEQWLMADDHEAAAAEFARSIADGGQTFADPRVYLARALQGLSRQSEADELLSELTANRSALNPRTCDLLAELYTDSGDLITALDWANTGVERCLHGDDNTELLLLLRLRYRIRNDLGLDEDDYDRMLR
jgi:hypothetical protein